MSYQRGPWRRRFMYGGGLGLAFLILAVLRLIVGNGLIWHLMR